MHGASRKGGHQTRPARTTNKPRRPQESEPPPPPRRGRGAASRPRAKRPLGPAAPGAENRWPEVPARRATERTAKGACAAQSDKTQRPGPRRRPAPAARRREAWPPQRTVARNRGHCRGSHGRRPRRGSRPQTDRKGGPVPEAAIRNGLCSNPLRRSEGCNGLEQTGRRSQTLLATSETRGGAPVALTSSEAWTAGGGHGRRA
jgi:hypothetical protein